jgi:hypothetical protein
LVFRESVPRHGSQRAFSTERLDGKIAVMTGTTATLVVHGDLALKVLGYLRVFGKDF